MPARSERQPEFHTLRIFSVWPALRSNTARTKTKASAPYSMIRLKMLVAPPGSTISGSGSAKKWPR